MCYIDGMTEHTLTKLLLADGRATENFHLDGTVPPGVICTSAAGFTRWTHGQCTRFARACTSGRTNEARDETETKPRESRVLQ